MSSKGSHLHLNDIARLLFETMRRQNLTATQLAARLGCHRSHLYRWLNGECLPHKMSHLQGIAQVCGRDLQSVLDMVVEMREGFYSDHLWNRLRASLPHVKEPGDLAGALAVVAELFQVEQVELFLAGPSAVAYLWCAGAHPFDPARIGALIRIYGYAVIGGALAPQTREETIVRAFAIRQPVEFADTRPLASSTALVVSPLLQGERAIGCLALSSPSRAGLAPAERSLLKEVCRYLAEVLTEHRAVFEHLGRVHGARILVDIYRELRGEDPPPLDGKSPLAILAEQADELGRILLSIARQLRLAKCAFHDLSIQQIDASTGTMLAIGTDHGKVLQPPALFDAVTAPPCWEAFKSGRPVYRPDLSKENPYDEGDLSESQPVLAILDLPFAWGPYQGTIGVNSLQASPWTAREIKAIETLVRRFNPKKKR